MSWRSVSGMKTSRANEGELHGYCNGWEDYDVKRLISKTSV